VAVNCWVAPTAIEAEVGLIVIDCSTGVDAVTASAAAGVLTTPPDVAVMLVLPAATPVASPVAPMVAYVVAEELQVIPEVRV
jgi:hypothetical protein